MDDAQAAARYREFADACMFRAKRGRNAVEWTKLAWQWEALARMRAGIFPASGCAKVQRRRDTPLLTRFADPRHDPCP